jgi:branched-chain amino acid aminotransferase
LNENNRSQIFNYAILNGACIPQVQVQVSLFDQALLSSFGVYEAIKVDQGRPFHLEEHLQRLLKSAELLDLSLGVEVSTLVDLFNRLKQVDPQATWRLTIIGLGAVEAGRQPIIAMQPEPLRSYPEHLYQHGARVVLYEGQRALPACKSLNTLVNFLARRAATRAGALEGLLHHAGYLTEGARSNLFVVRGGQLLTPPAATVLAGITRDIIVQVMADTPHPVVEDSLSIDLSQYEEFFISSTSMHVMPVTEIDGQPIGTGQVGPVTRLAMARFATHYQQIMGVNDE